MVFGKKDSEDIVADIMSKGIAKLSHFARLRDKLMGTLAGMVNVVVDAAPSPSPVPHARVRTAAYRTLKLTAGLAKDKLTRALRGEHRRALAPGVPGQARSAGGVEALVAHFAQVAGNIGPGWRERLWSDASARTATLLAARNVVAKVQHRGQDLRRAALWLERRAMADDDRGAG
jgi:hypothetical protein